MSAPATLKVPAALYDEALAFVNDRRAENSLPPLAALPAGKPHRTRSCPCAAKCGRPIVVTYGRWWWEDGDRHDDDNPRGFVAFFDHNAADGVRTLPVREGGA